MRYNQNDAMRNRFLLSIPDAEGMTLKVLNAPIPGVSSNPIELGGYNFHVVEDGDHVDYETAVWRFIVDEDLSNYVVMLNWLIDNVTKGDQLRRDGTMKIFRTNGKTPIRDVVYESMRPISLSEIDYGTDDADSVTLTCTVMMKFEKFTVSDKLNDL